MQHQLGTDPSQRCPQVCSVCQRLPQRDHAFRHGMVQKDHAIESTGTQILKRRFGVFDLACAQRSLSKMKSCWNRRRQVHDGDRTANTHMRKVSATRISDPRSPAGEICATFNRHEGVMISRTDRDVRRISKTTKPDPSGGKFLGRREIRQIAGDCQMVHRMDADISSDGIEHRLGMSRVLASPRKPAQQPF